MANDVDPSEPAASFERSSKLPEEILDAHRIRAEFLKWKLLLVAVLGAAGLGLSKDYQAIYLLLALIPFVCIYVDLLCTNIKVRVIVIGTFYADVRRDSYELYTRRNRDVFKTEPWAQSYSTYAICLVVGVIAALSETFNTFTWHSSPRLWVWEIPTNQDSVLFVAALAGIIVSFWTNKRSQTLLDALTAETDSPEFQNAKLGGLLRWKYTTSDFKALRTFLTQKGVFIFPCLPNGLFSASASAGAKDTSGYQNAWVRDNIHVAHAHYACGDKASARRNLSALMTYFQKHRARFRQIIEDKPRAKMKPLADDPMNRPHIRYDGRTLEELDEKWGHAQNDALGYFLWAYCKLAQDGTIEPSQSELECLADFPLFFEAIRYWQDQDSGHWEETRKVSASSIGVVVAGLREYSTLITKNELANTVATKAGLDSTKLDRLRLEGESALKEILPCESIAPEKFYRRYDSALLFLVYPLEVLADDIANTVIEDIVTHLQGDYGIRRYVGDSYWFPDYNRVPDRKKTSDHSGGTEKRDAYLRIGDEAQWCIFDPIMSVIYGRRYLRHTQAKAQNEADECLHLQTVYFNRALSQLTMKSKKEPRLRAPEAYYLENGHYVPNDHTPLLWTQANLWLAMHQMQESVSIQAKG